MHGHNQGAKRDISSPSPKFFSDYATAINTYIWVLYLWIYMIALYFPIFIFGFEKEKCQFYLKDAERDELKNALDGSVECISANI